jgi:hypothetical protein
MTDGQDPNETIPNPFDIAAQVPSSMSAGEVLHLISLFDRSLERMETRIIAKMEENSEGAKERWKRHDEALAANTIRVVSRFEKMESALLKVETLLDQHLDREHEEDIRMDARIRPLRGSISWLWAQRKDIVIVLIGFGVFATFLLEAFGRILGPHAP